MDRDAARTPTAPSIKLRYLGQDGSEREITSWDALVRAIIGGDLTDDSPIQMPGWVKAGDHPQFQALKARIDRARTARAEANPGEVPPRSDAPLFPSRHRTKTLAAAPAPRKTEQPASPIVDFDRLKHAHRPEKNPFVDVSPLAAASPQAPNVEPPAPKIEPQTSEAAEQPPWRDRSAGPSQSGIAGIPKSPTGEDKPIFAPAEIENVEGEMRRFARSIWLFVFLASIPILLSALLVVQSETLADAVGAHRWVLPAMGTLGAHWASALDLAATLAAVLTFLVAGHRARNIAEDLLIYGYRWSYGWTVLSLFVPVLNLVRPWLGFGELHRALVNAARIGRIGSHWRHGFSDAALLLGLAWIGTAVALAALHRAYAADDLSGSRLMALLIMELVARLLFLVVSAGFLARLYMAARDVVIEIARPRTGVSGSRAPWRA